jgi:hypothetical protein
MLTWPLPRADHLATDEPSVRDTVIGIVFAILTVVVFLVALRIKRAGRIPARLRPLDGSDTLPFAITPIEPAGPAARAWRATYAKDGATGEFGLHLDIAEPTDQSPFAEGTVTLSRARDANGALLLRDFARALGLQNVPAAGTPVNTLTCSATFMGSHLTRGDGPDVIAGAFTTSPPGEWVVAKLFFSDGQGEVFLAVNPATARGEFLAKDPELSPAVIREFGRLF